MGTVGENGKKTANDSQVSYDPEKYTRGMTTSPKEEEEELDPSDGSILNAKNHILCVTFVEGTYKEPLGFHALNYGNVESMPYMNMDETEMRFLCTGRKWNSVKKQWREAIYEVLVEGKFLRRMYSKAVAGVRTIIRPTVPHNDSKKVRVDRVSIKETRNVTFQPRPEDWDLDEEEP